MADESKEITPTAQMFGLVGIAITEWSFLEQRLAQIFTICTSPVVADVEGGLNFGNSSVSNGVFYAVENFRGKLSLIDAALTAHVWGNEP